MAAGEFGSVWSWKDKASRGEYALVGAIGFAIKHNFDRFLASRFGFPWGTWSYLDPLSRALRDSPLTAEEKKFLAILLITALPFIWVGISMTVKRLRDAGQPLWLTLLFFAKEQLHDTGQPAALEVLRLQRHLPGFSERPSHGPT